MHQLIYSTGTSAPENMKPSDYRPTAKRAKRVLESTRSYVALMSSAQGHMIRKKMKVKSDFVSIFCRRHYRFAKFLKNIKMFFKGMCKQNRKAIPMKAQLFFVHETEVTFQCMKINCLIMKCIKGFSIAIRYIYTYSDF